MSKSKHEQMPPKTITYRSSKNFTEEQFKEAIRSDCSYIEGGNLTSLQRVIEKRLDQFALLGGDDKPQFRKAFMKES